ncbi:MAG: cyclic nucleotide-binding domain-containing protein [Anaerolineae bacterium]|nr:cyclic nucleotide-binding domain-containing protein [Anaerolineae bacterium]
MEAMGVGEYLREVPLFSRLSEDNLERVAAIARQTAYPRRSTLATAGQPGHAFCLILSGEAVVHALLPGGRMRPVNYLRPGSYFGVTSLLLGEPHDATVVATTDVVALVVDRADLNRLRQEDPSLDQQLSPPQPVAAKLRHIHLPWLADDEVVVYLGRRHWFVLARAMLLPTLGLALVSLLLRSLARALLLSLGGVAALFALPVAIYLGLMIWHLLDWRNDYFAVTTQRIVSRVLVILQRESREEAPLNMVQNVLVERDRAGQLLGFGRITVQTAAQRDIGNIIFDYLPNPDLPKEVIFQQLYRAQARSQVAAQERVRGELRRRLGLVSPEEIQAEVRERTELAGLQPPGRREGRRAGARRFRVLPPVRIERGNTITWRKHYLFLLQRTSGALLTGVLWLIVIIAYLAGSLAIPFAGGPGALLGLVVVGLAIAFWFWWQLEDWKNDVYIVTEDRIVDVEKVPLWGREERREADLERVQNVNLVIPGPVAAALRYGNVDIDTAGPEGKFTFTNVVEPHQVQREIMFRVAQARERRQQLESQRRQREIADWFAVYEGLRKEQGKAAPPQPPGEES